jgi:nucleoside-diphosphate-sugar epimerase
VRILLTGHDGYIGAVLVPLLLSAGHEVVGLDAGYFSDCKFGENPPQIEALRRDIRDVRAADVAGFDSVIHLAAISNDPLGNLNPDCTYDINHRASVRLAEMAKTAGVSRFLYSSSCSVYGAASQEDVLDEQATFAPVTPYAQSKVWVERDVISMADDDFSPTFMRNATVYGVSPRLRGDLVVNNLVGWALTTGEVMLKSDGTPWRPLVHVEDVGNAFAAALMAPREAVHAQAFNVGRPGENYRIRTVAEMVHEAIPDSKLSFAAGAGADPRCYRVDFSKIGRALPRFNPSWNVQRGIHQLRDAFRAVGMTREDLEGNRYLRIKTILQLLEAGLIDSDLRWTSRQGVTSK